MSRLDDPEAAPELYRYLVPGKPDEGRVGPEFVDQLERCICRFYVLFPGGEVPEVVEAKRFREVKSSGRCP